MNIMASSLLLLGSMILLLSVWPVWQLIFQLPKGSNAQLLAERLRFAVENTILVKDDENEGRGDLQITISIGVATMAGDLTSSQQLVEQADKALYLAKERGRNMVEPCSIIEG